MYTVAAIRLSNIAISTRRRTSELSLNLNATDTNVANTISSPAMGTPVCGKKSKHRLSDNSTAKAQFGIISTIGPYQYSRASETHVRTTQTTTTDAIIWNTIGSALAALIAKE